MNYILMTVGFLYLFYYDWKIALAILLIMVGNVL